MFSKTIHGKIVYAESTSCSYDRDKTKIEQHNTLNTGIKNLFTSETPV